MKTIDEMMKDWREEHSLKCPWCKEDFTDDSEFKEDLITYHAEDGAKEKECGNCGQKFFVKELVDRTWEVGTELDDNGDPKIDDDKLLQRQLEGEEEQRNNDLAEAHIKEQEALEDKNE